MASPVWFGTKATFLFHAIFAHKLAVCNCFLVLWARSSQHCAQIGESDHQQRRLVTAFIAT
jgi:hypothetical protein